VIAAQLVPFDRAEAVGRAVGAHGSTPRTPETWPGLDDQVRSHRQAIGGTWEEQRRVAVAVELFFVLCDMNRSGTVAPAHCLR